MKHSRLGFLFLFLFLIALSGGCGDDAAPADDASEPCSSQMFDKYGQAGFEAVNSNIIANIGSVSAMNPSPIGDSFKGLTGEEVSEIEANLLDLLIMVYGGPSNYTGRSMQEAHAGLDITQAQYDAFISMVVVPALAQAGVPESDITQCFAPPVVDAAFVATIVGQ